MPAYSSLPLSPVHEDYKSLDDVPLRRASLSGHNGKKRRSCRSCLYPVSIVTNIILFVGILFVLAKPCYFSDRACRYDGSELDKLSVGDDDNERQTYLPSTLTKQPEGSRKATLMGDRAGVVPDFSTEEVVFTEDLRYANPNMFKNKTEYDRVLLQWAEDMPIGRGFIQIANSSTNPLLSRPWHNDFAPGLDGYSIASLHQLHCLYMILTHTGSLAFPDRPMMHAHHHEHQHGGATKRDGGDDDDDSERHATHCFDYLRQTVRCAGDATLEGKSASVDGVTDGWGDTHVCKKNSELWDWVVANRYSDKEGIA